MYNKDNKKTISEIIIKDKDEIKTNLRIEKCLFLLRIFSQRIIVNPDSNPEKAPKINVEKRLRVIGSILQINHAFFCQRGEANADGNAD